MQNKDTKKTVSAHKKYKLLLALVFIILITFFATIYLTKNNKLYQLEVNGKNINVEIADETSELIQGLSGRQELAKNNGLLFIFSSSDYWGIWMKDMKFPIDIVWIDNNGRVVDLKENVSPDSYPEVFKPIEKAKYVLEFNSGLVKELGIVKQTEIKNVMLK